MSQQREEDDAAEEELNVPTFSDPALGPPRTPLRLVQSMLKRSPQRAAADGERLKGHFGSKTHSWLPPAVRSGGAPFWEQDDEYYEFYDDDDEEEEEKAADEQKIEQQDEKKKKKKKRKKKKVKKQLSRVSRWWHRAQANRSFMEGLQWGLRMGVAGFFAGLLPVVIVLVAPDVGALLFGTRLFIVPLAAVLCTGRTLAQTETMSRDCILGAIWGSVWALPTAQLIWLVLPGPGPGQADAPDGNYVGRCLLISAALLVFIPLTCFSPWSGAIEKKINMAVVVFGMFALLPSYQDAWTVFFSAGQIALLFAVGGGAAYAVFFLSPRQSTVRVAKRSLRRTVKRLIKLHALLWRSYAALNEPSVPGATLIDVRVGAQVLIRKAYAEIEHGRQALELARSVFPHFGRTRDVSKGVDFMDKCTRALEHLVGMRRALALHPLFTARSTTWHALSRLALPALRDLQAHVDESLYDVVHNNGKPQPEHHHIAESLAALHDAYQRARRHVFYQHPQRLVDSDTDTDSSGVDEPSRRAQPRELNWNPHHLFVFYYGGFAEAAAHIETTQLEFPARLSLLADLLQLLQRYASVHRIPAYVANYARAVVANRDEFIRALLTGLVCVLLSLFGFVPALYALYPRAAWAPVTAVFVSDIQSSSSTFRTGVQRIVGTTIGSLLGLITGWIALSVGLLAPLLAFFVAFGSGYARSSPRWSYAGNVCAFTSMVFLFSASAAGSIDQLRTVVLQRIELTFLGVFAVLLVSWVWSKSARVMLIRATLDNFNNFMQLIRAVFEPWARHRRPLTDQAYRDHVAELAKRVRASIDGQTALSSMAEEEPAFWRHEFDAKAWAALIAAQKALLQTFEFLKLFVAPESRAHLLFDEWVGTEITELQVELCLVLEHLAPLVSSRKSLRVATDVIRLETAEFTTPIQVAQWIHKLYRRYEQAVEAHRGQVSQGIKDMLPTADILPITGFVISLNDIYQSLDQVWQTTYELYSRHRFELD